jgi:Fur family ferric uptake transcriptional regulator
MTRAGCNSDLGASTSNWLKLALVGSDRAQQLIGRLRAEGRRITAARRSLADALVAAGGHVTAEELIAELQAKHPDLASSTVYRLLVDLEDLGLVVHVHLGHGPAAYHLADAAHVHLVCEGCGSITELPPEMVDAMAAQLHAGFGFRARFDHFSIGGRCQGCAPGSPPAAVEQGQTPVTTRRAASNRSTARGRRTPPAWNRIGG